MRKKRREEWLTAIDKLIEWYWEFRENEIPNSISVCPLCEMARDKWGCSNCPWMIFEGKKCRGFERQTTIQRLRRLTDWQMKLIDYPWWRLWLLRVFSRNRWMRRLLGARR